MVIWSFQPKSILKDLENNGVYHCDPNKSWLLEFEEFEYAYGWLMEQMDEKMKRPIGVSSPIWGWSKNCESTPTGKPDLRKHNTYDSEYVLLELNISEDRLMESCFDKWHVVLNNCPYVADSELEHLTDEEWDELWGEQQKYSRERIEDSWTNVFDVGDSCCKQVTFWEIKKEDVVKVHEIKRKPKNSNDS